MAFRYKCFFSRNLLLFIDVECREDFSNELQFMNFSFYSTSWTRRKAPWSLWHFTGDLRLKCDISRLLLLAQNPDWLIFSYRFLRRSATSFPTQTKTTFQNSGGSFGNWQYIFMRQKGKTLWRNPIFHIADIFYAFDVCMLPAKLSSFFSKGELHQTSRFFAAIQ